MIDNDDPDAVVDARLVAEAAVPVRGPARRWSGGGWIVPGVGPEVFALGTDLAVSATFPVPEELPRCSPERPAREEDYRVDVSPDGRWAVFAGTDRTVVVDTDGRVVWRMAHPSFRDRDGDLVPAAAVFRPDGSALWAFVSAGDPSSPDTGARATGAERHVVSVADWRVTAVVPSAYTGLPPGDIVVHPGGDLVGFAGAHRYGVEGFYTYAYEGFWVRCDDTSEAVLSTGDWCPLEVSPDGRRWIGQTGSTPVIGDFADGVVIEPDRAPFTTDDEEEEEDVEADSACFVTSELVVAAGGLWENRHVFADALTLRRVASIEYPPSEDDHYAVWVGGDGDGTWMTSTGRAPWEPGAVRLRRWEFDGAHE
ncbi:hypothetical protein GCM10023196_034040 [Actinoallomurus vinaceus]|uniref:Uncharacterized protein n=1 Tax=Actinoallomurus vinaceus TaxID=1080074 RepID=A0ABP8UD13_9ACTN